MLSWWRGDRRGSESLLVAKFKLHPFIVTLGTQLILYSCLLLYVQMGNNGGMAISSLDASYTDFVKEPFDCCSTGNGTWHRSELCLVRHPCCRTDKIHLEQDHVRQEHVRSGLERRSGPCIRRQRVRHHDPGLCPRRAMHGWVPVSVADRLHRLNTANTGFNYELDAIAACVIGGVSFVGGIGKIRGIIIGVLLLRLIFVGLNMASVPQDLIYLVKGGIILFACALDMRKYLVKK